MKIPKGKIRVKITCIDETLIEGTIHIREGLRMLDGLNCTEERFVALTDAKFSNAKIMPLGLHKAILSKEKDFMALNKSSIKWIEEIKK